MDPLPLKPARRTFLALAVGIATAPVVAGAQAARSPVRIGTIPTEIGAAAYFGKELGWFDRAGFDVQIQQLSSGAAVVAAVIGNALEVGFTNPISLSIAHDKGLPVTIIAGAGIADAKHPSNGLLVVADGSPIRTAKNLDGKTIGVSGLGNINHLAVRNWIDVNGGDSKNARYVELALPLMAAAIEGKRVDAAAMDNAGVASARGTLRVIASTYDSYAPLFIASYWFATTAWVSNNPDTAKRVAGILRDAGAWANAHMRDAHTIWTRNSKYSLAELEAVDPPIFATSVPPQMLQPCVDVAAKYGVIAKRFPAKDLISNIAE